jgi:hypothetical protein
MFLSFAIVPRGVAAPLGCGYFIRLVPSASPDTQQMAIIPATIGMIHQILLLNMLSSPLSPPEKCDYQPHGSYECHGTQNVFPRLPHAHLPPGIGMLSGTSTLGSLI